MSSASEKAITRRVKQHVIGKPQRFFAVVQPGFEETARQELQEVGVREFSQTLEGGIEFSAKLESCYRVNMASRTLTRLLMRLVDFKAVYLSQLKRKAAEFPWELYLREGVTVAFKVQSSHSRLNHKDRVAAALTKGIRARLADYLLKVKFADNKGKEEGQTIFVRLQDDRCGISLDTSGGLLYKRGRKIFTSTASLRETLAALILREARWPEQDRLVDPMTGSGTFAMEACEMLAGRLPNQDRFFPFMSWPAFRPAAYRYLKEQLSPPESGQTPDGKEIQCLDIDPQAVETVRKNAAASDLTGFLDRSLLQIRRHDFLDARGTDDLLKLPDSHRGLLVLNPPYGKRLNPGATKTLYRKIGGIIRNHPTWDYAIIVPGLEYEKILSLPHDRKILFMNGGLKVSVIFKFYQP